MSRVKETTRQRLTASTRSTSALIMVRSLSPLQLFRSRWKLKVGTSGLQGRSRRFGSYTPRSRPDDGFSNDLTTFSSRRSSICLIHPSLGRMRGRPDAWTDASRPCVGCHVPGSRPSVRAHLLRSPFPSTHHFRQSSISRQAPVWITVSPLPCSVSSSAFVMN